MKPSDNLDKLLKELEKGNDLDALLDDLDAADDLSELLDALRSDERAGGGGPDKT